MTSISLYVSFLLGSVKRINTVGIVNDDDFLANCELSRELPPLGWYLVSLNARDIVRVLKGLVVFISSVLPGDHYYIVSAWVSTQ